MPPIKKEKTNKKVKVSEKKNVSAENAAISMQLDKKLKQKQSKEKKQRGVVFIKHLPHGFFEEQLSKYFSQFGNVTRLRLARSKRSGGSKGYAFVEFEYPEVAQVAAETMDNYLMFQKIVKAQYIPPEKQRFNFFKSSVRQVKDKTGKNIYISCKTATIRRRAKKHNDWSDVNYQRRTVTKLNKIKKLKEKYAHLGIDFSKIIIEPKKANHATNESNNKVENVEKESTAVASSSKSKRKLPADNKIVTGKTKKTKNLNESLKLEDLLGSTINDDSNDEDYVASTKEEDTSDEESYGFLTKDDDENNTTEESLKTEDLLGDTINDDSNDEDYVADEKDYSIEDHDEDNNNKRAEESDELNDSHEPLVKLKKKAKQGKSLAKSLKSKGSDPFEQLIKRKPLSGGIKKAGKKNLKAPLVLKPKNTKMLKAAKEIAKPLKTIKNKKN